MHLMKRKPQFSNRYKNGVGFHIIHLNDVEEVGRAVWETNLYISHYAIKVESL